MQNCEVLREEIATRIRQRIDKDNFTVIVHQIPKTNIVLDAVTITSKSCNISPTIYLSPFYEKIEDEDMSVEDVAEEILRIYMKHRQDKSIDVSDFLDFEKQKDNLRMKVINFAMNEDTLLKETPYIKYLDLAVIFYIDLSGTMQDATVVVKNNHLAMWNTTTEELFEIAQKNRQDYKITSMLNVLADMGQFDSEELETMLEHEDEFMYVCTNESKLFGAAAILYTDIFEKFAEEKQMDLYIIGSSIHELIIIPDNGRMAWDEISEMMVAVNCSEVSKDEVLTDHPYHYSRETKKITYQN